MSQCNAPICKYTGIIQFILMNICICVNIINNIHIYYIINNIYT